MRTDPVTRKPASTGCRDLGAARLVQAEREREAASPHSAAASKETIGTASDRVTDGRAALGKPTLFHEIKLGHWARLFGEDCPVSRLDADAFDTFVRRRRGEGISNHTISKEVACMLRALKLSKRLGLYSGDLDTLRPPDLSAGYVPRTRTLSAPELAALLAELPEHRGAFVALCVGLGLRRGEAFALRPEHVSLDAGLVDVPGTKTDGARRTIPILPPFRGLVEKAARFLPLPVWPSGADCRDLEAACRRAGIERCSPNDLRRTHATLLRSAKVDPDTVRRLLGHSASSRMLEAVYDKPSGADLAARAGDLGAITRQLDAAFAEKPAGNPQPQWARGASSVPATVPFRRENLTASDPGDSWGRVGIGTETLHSPQAHALALAFVNVARRGAA